MKTWCSQALCVSAILAGVYGLTVFGRPSGSPPIDERPALLSIGRHARGHKDDRLADLRGMPACVELQESLVRLQEKRFQLLQTTATGDAMSTTAAREYQDSVQRFQAALGRVQERVNPEDLSRVLREFTSDASFAVLANPGVDAIHPWELGDYIQEITP